MAYRLKLREGLHKGIRRIGLEQIERVEAHLRAEQDVATAVHDARRCLKRLRALLLLVRPALEADLYRKETRRLAQVGRMLAGARDRFVMCQSLAGIEKAAGPLPGDCGPLLQALITQGHDLAAPPEPGLRHEALVKLGASRKFFSGRALHDVSMTDVWEGLEAAHRKGRHAFRACYRKPDDEAVHAWRKAVQRHWRHMALVSRAWPQETAARIAEAKMLSQILGEDHDLAVLAALASRHREQLPEEGVAILIQHAKGRQKDLRALARLHGDRLYAEPPEDLVERLAGYWEATRSLHKFESAAPAEAEPQAPESRGSPTPLQDVASAADGSQAPRATATESSVRRLPPRGARKRARA
ncbi:MAG: CHAD domain-containing protein [Hyphomicrobiaceae bacterium]|nr:CHAD domain-containing protein [Hyphomicrobiaceae bacterium]